MSNYVIFTDSACDLSRQMLDSLSIKYCALSFAFEGSDTVYSNYDLTPKEFYKRMRAGSTAKTSAANSETFSELFEQELKQGNDILYLGFSSGLSATYNCARIAADELKAKYEDRKIITVDTLSASAGFGMIVYLTAQKKEQGATIEQAAEYAQGLVGGMCHWFTVDDLVYLKRGGRISPTVALVGSVLGIKPVLHMDDKGHLVSKFKVRGRKTAIKALADKFGELAVDKTSGPVYLCHADCEEDANTLKQMINQTYGVDVELIVDVGPVIGAHSGPGTLAIFFIGKNR